MSRTTVMLPTELKARAMRLARSKGLSLSDFIREIVITAVQESTQQDGADPLFADNAVFDGPSPTDVAKHHDRYLYEDRS